MKKQLALALVPALLVLASIPAWGSDGDIMMLSDVARGNSGKSCPFWQIQWKSGTSNGVPFGVCQPPVITVYGELKGASAGGITGAEFAGMIGPNNAPDFGYFLLEIPNPEATTVLGSAFFPPDPAPRGMNMVFDACQTGGTTGLVELLKIIVIPLVPCGPGQSPPQLNMMTGQHSSPSNVFFRCPLFTLCDAPAYTKVCLGDNIVMCTTPVPPFPQASMCSTSGSYAINDPTQADIGTCPNVKGKAAAPASIEDATWSNVKAMYR